MILTGPFAGTGVAIGHQICGARPRGGGLVGTMRRAFSDQRRRPQAPRIFGPAPRICERGYGVASHSGPPGALLLAILNANDYTSLGSDYPVIGAVDERSHPHPVRHGPGRPESRRP